jgi:dimethylargininase
MQDGELTHVARSPIDMRLADEQHAAYRAALEQCGARVTDLPAIEAHPDGAFVEDVAVIFPQITIHCRPGAESRRGEVIAMVPNLPADRPWARIEAPATVDGGDVLCIGRSVFIGRSSRTNDAGIAAIQAHLAPHGYTVTPIDVRHSLHLKTAVTALDDDRLLINPNWVDAGKFGGRPTIEVSPDEPFGANALRIGDRIIYGAHSARTADRLEQAGYRVIRVEASEFAKAEAGMTCLSLVFE